MGIYTRARRSALTAICAGSVVAGIAAVAVPGTALAAVPCEKITGSGSSLQAAQQTKWTTGRKFATCTPEEPGIVYTATGSGQGLKEWGIPGGVLLPKESGNKVTLDAYVGTDDPQAKAALGEAKKASESKAITVPVVAAPIAMIIHPPTGCVPTAAEFKISEVQLDSLWKGTYTNWKGFLTAVVGATGFSEEPKGACEVAIKHEVRFDGSGTSYAFKQYLSQIDAATWSTFVTDEPTWPAGTAAITEHEEGGKKVPNKGSGGEAKAVGLEAGSVGYVNLANAAEGEFSKYAAKGTKFWARVRNVGASGEPEGKTKTGNCPAALAVALTAKQKEEAKGEGVEGENGPNWSTVHLANTKTAGAYPLCTLTYDMGWETYTTPKLEGVEEYNKKGTAVKNTALAYFEYMTNGGQSNIASYYSTLPEEILTIAKADAKKV